MSGFENYPAELAELDHEIRHYAAVCGVDLADRIAVKMCLDDLTGAQAGHPEAARSRETLRGLLMLRLRIETEMLQDGRRPPEMVLPGKA